MSDPRELLDSCDIYLHLGLNEGAPLALAEAAMAGKPIVAASEGGIPELLTDDVNAILVSPHPAAVADSIERLICSKPLRQRLGNSARDHAVAHWTWSLIADQYLQLYRNQTK